MNKNRILPGLLALALCLTLAQPADALFGWGSPDTPAPAATVTPTPPDNGVPVARDLTVITYPDLAVCFRLKAMDPDKEPVTYALCSQPDKGKAELLADGTALYTPKGKKAYETSFTYQACDPNGNKSAPATVTVQVKKRPTESCLRYTDMENSPAHYAAVRLAEAGVLRGESIGASSFFCPEKTVTRSEFVAMVAAVCELPLPTANIATGMTDGDSIPAWARGSVVAAISQGIIKGGSADGQVFRGNDAVTRAEAAAILDRALGLQKDGRAAGFTDADTVPAWASQVLVNATAAGILQLDENGAVNASAAVTREDLAQMLHAAMTFRQEQEASASLWSKLFG